MRTRQWMTGVGAGALLLMGAVGAGSLVAAQEQATPTVSQAAAMETGEHDPSYTASIRVSEEDSEQSETDEAAALQSLATISADQAAQAATTAYPGASVMQIELDNENGWLVYSVELSNGSEVTVDAGNATVLATDQEDDQEREPNESNGEELDDDQERDAGESDDEEQDGANQEDDASESEVSAP